MIFVFKSASIKDWIFDIVYLRNSTYDNRIGRILKFDGLSVDDLGPQHVASLACLFEDWYRKGQTILNICSDSPVGRFLFEQLQIQKYWAGKKNYSESEVDSILNLWRVVETEKEIHGRRVSEYLKASYFKKKDLSAVENSLTEA